MPTKKGNQDKPRKNMKRCESDMRSSTRENMAKIINAFVSVF